MIRIGPAGWSCRDWEGIVYPRQKRFDQLRYLSGFFPTIEVNSTFYGPPRARITQSWIERTDHVPDFRFTLKLGRNFTHQRGPLDEVEIQQWKEGAAPLGEAGKLGALLVQWHCHVKGVGPQRPAWIPFQAAALAVSHTLNASFRNRLNVNLLRK